MSWNDTARQAAKRLRIIRCSRCGATCEARSQNRIYCDPCAEQANREQRAERWAKEKMARLANGEFVRATVGTWTCAGCGRQLPHDMFTSRRMRRCHDCRAMPANGHIRPEWDGYVNHFTEEERVNYYRSPCARCAMLRSCQVAVREGRAVACEVEA